MKSKTLPLLCLLTALLTPGIFAQTPEGSPQPPGNAYGIEPEKSYSGSVVLRLLELAEAEIDEAVNAAYAEGYKAGLLAALPDKVYFEALSERLEGDLLRKRRKPPGWVWTALGFAGGFLGHFLIKR